MSDADWLDFQQQRAEEALDREAWLEERRKPVTLVERLRQAADECSGWHNDEYPPYNDWSDLFDAAADALEAEGGRPRD